jgi:electron transfer flavoprotein alpha/beta subunit
MGPKPGAPGIRDRMPSIPPFPDSEILPGPYDEVRTQTKGAILVNIIVCIKQVPDTAEVKINPDTGTLMREGVPSIVNPFDTFAVEEALCLKEKFGGKVTVLTMGPLQAVEALKEAAAMGADEAILLSDRAFAGSDTWATAYTLALAIRKLGSFDIILCGKQAIDGDTGQVGPGIAVQLAVPALTYVSKINRVDTDPPPGTIEVERVLDEGRETLQTSLPVLLTVVKDINIPRLSTITDIRRAVRMKIPTWTAADLVGADPKKLGLEGSPTRVITICSPPGRGGAVDMIPAENADKAASVLVEKILAEKIL